MSISNDYLDASSEVSKEFLLPVKQLLESKDTALKTIKIFAKYRLENEPVNYQSTYTFSYSEEVQNMIAKNREEDNPFNYIQESYQNIMSSIREKSEGRSITLKHLEITVVYANRSNLSTDLTFVKTA